MHRAWQITGEFAIDKLTLSQLPDPDPAPGQVVVGVRAVSLNFRDLLVARGLYSKKVPLPLTLCSDAAGEVLAVGPGVTRFAPGHRVAGTFMPAWISGQVNDAIARTARGAFAPGVLTERLLADQDSLVTLPNALSFEEAATLPCAAVTAWNALVVEGRVKAGDNVLVQGTGGVSIFALQFALAAGARVIAITSTQEKADRLRALGAHDVINYVERPDWEEAARKLTGGGVDQVIEIGGAATIGKSIRAARMGGFIALIGNRAEGPADVNLTAALMKAIRIQGIFVGSRDMFEAMNRAIALHAIRPIVDRVFPFDQAREAMQHLASGAHFSKVCVSVGSA
ncbi:MAG: NAD(P)-dependent alcohol dehydrogenase [Bryobacteraceae bacterium]